MFPVSIPRRAQVPRWLAEFVAAASVLLALAAHAQQALTLDQALRIAQDRSRQLVAQDAAAAASRDMAVAAGQRPDPTLKAGVNNLPIDTQDRFSLTRDFMTMRSVGLTQEITRSDKLKARSARFEREAEIAEAAKSLALSTLRRDTALAWLDRHFQERMLDLLRTQRIEARLQIDAAETSYRGGRGAQADVFAARSAVALIDDRIRLNERQLAIAKTRLERWLGNQAQRPLASPPALDLARLDPIAIESQLAHHPELAVMARQEEMALADAEIARSNKHSDWSVELMLSQRGSAYSNMVSFNISIPLQVDPKQRQDRELAAKLALAEQLRAQREEVTREHLAETRSWLQEWQSNRERLSHYDKTLIPLAAQRTEAAMAAYRGGSGSLGSVLEARRGEIDNQMDRLRLEMETAVRWAQLEFLVPSAHDGNAVQRPLSALEK